MLSSDDWPLDTLDSGLNALFATQVAEEVFEAVNFEALRAGEPINQAVDLDHLTRTIGQPAGRLLARELARQAPGGKVTEVLGREIGGLAAAFVFQRILEEADPDAAAALLGPPGPPIDEFEDAVTVEIEPGDNVGDD